MVELLDALGNFTVFIIWIFVLEFEVLAPVTEIRTDYKEISIILKIWLQNLSIAEQLVIIDLSNHKWYNLNIILLSRSRLKHFSDVW
jgi:hypothetical protein